MEESRFTVALIDGQGQSIDLRNAKIKILDASCGLIQIRWNAPEEEENDVCEYCGAGDKHCTNCGAPLKKRREHVDQKS